MNLILHLETSRGLQTLMTYVEIEKHNSVMEDRRQTIGYMNLSQNGNNSADICI